LDSQTSSFFIPIEPKNKTLLIVLGYLFVLFSPIIAVIIGSTLRYKRVMVGKNEREYKYSDRDRKNGEIIANLAAALFYINLFFELTH